jgi:predicted neutral ceramidase superfamily lipid hydrolase
MTAQIYTYRIIIAFALLGLLIPAILIAIKIKERLFPMPITIIIWPSSIILYGVNALRETPPFHIMFLLYASALILNIVIYSVVGFIAQFIYRGISQFFH